MQEFRNLPKISVMQSELDIINIQIEKLILQNKYIKLDIKNTVRKKQETRIIYLNIIYIFLLNV